MTDPTTRGPYETGPDAREAARPIYDAHPGTPLSVGNHRLLEEACEAAGVEPGGYGHKILLWLAEWEPETCVVVADLITRAHAASGGVRPTAAPGSIVGQQIRNSGP